MSAHDDDDEIEMNTQEGRSAFAFLRWLKDNDIGVGLCHLHTVRDATYGTEATPDEWVALIEEWENDDGETDPGRDDGQ
jgi:hypothetical protein